MATFPSVWRFGEAPMTAMVRGRISAFMRSSIALFDPNSRHAGVAVEGGIQFLVDAAKAARNREELLGIGQRQMRHVACNDLLVLLVPLPALFQRHGASRGRDPRRLRSAVAGRFAGAPVR